MRVDQKRLYEHIGHTLRRRRLELGMTQAHLGAATGELRTSIANLEAGRQKTPLPVLYNLCEALDLEISEVLPPLAEVVERDAEVVDVPGVNRAVPPRAAAFLQDLRESLEDAGE